MIRRLKAIPDEGIQTILQVSFDLLQDNKDKDLFLHIACFFTGEDRDYVARILAHCELYPVVGIQTLIDRCLLFVSKENKLLMHPLIQEMGREIVRQESPNQPGKRSRLWHHWDSFDVLTQKMGTNNIEGLALDMKMLKKDRFTRSEYQNYSTERSWYQELIGKLFASHWMTSSCTKEAALRIDSFEMMDNLMILKLYYVTFTGSYQNFPKRLRLLCWHGFPLKTIPLEISLGNLIALDMSYSKLKQVWKGYKLLESLKILDLSYSEELVTTPNFRGLPRLETLILRGCLSLSMVCGSITHLKGLVFLDLDDCKSLRNIPCLPTCLEILKMSGCENIFDTVEHLEKRWS